MPSLGPDDDLAKLIPDAPPRPDRREATIAEAMRRFDGEKSAPEGRRPQWIRPGWLQLGRPQWGVLMSAAVVAVIGVPLALTVVREQMPVAPPAEQARLGESAEASNAASGAVHAAPKVEASRAALPTEARPTQVAAKQDQGVAGLLARSEPSPVMAAPPPPPPPAPLAQILERRVATPASAAIDEDKAPIVTTGSRIARNDYTSNSPVVVADSKALAKSPNVREAEEGGQSEGLSIVITGSRISRSMSRASERGDWNACTVYDPAHDLDQCRRQIGVGAKGDAGRAAARVADGISEAWSGNTEDAIADFDAAITIRPKLAFAYLNRGMVYARRGETERAVKDFDQAISKAPYDARAYYQRSVALRSLGKDSRAISDAERAVSLDRRYEDLFD